MCYWSSIIGPRLYRIYTFSQQPSGSSIYMPNRCETFGNNIVQSINVMWNIGLYTSPLIFAYLYKRNYFCVLGCVSLGKFAAGISVLLVIGILLRGIGRSLNPTYISFLKTYQTAMKDYKDSDRVALSKYDFQMSYHPVDFSVKDLEGSDKPFSPSTSATSENKVGFVGKVLSVPCYLTAYLCVHLFGRHLIYPGSIHLLQFVMDNLLQNGREKLVVEHKGSRYKILTQDDNEIDTMFVDLRNSKLHTFGSTLVVCCEGNAGFYEVGTMSVPLEAGYSVLGWNHPGFAGSTGKPFPSQDQFAIDAVMQFAIHKLKFRPENIIIYAWSIGGYTGTWAAMNYPQIRGIVLDATFDDILPLALPRMPSWMGGLIKHSVREFMNLNNAEQLCQYPGPVTIIRRIKDEIITTVEGDMTTNRGNNLLLKLLKYRYPKLLSCSEASDVLSQWIVEDANIAEAMYRSFSIDEEMCLTWLITYIEEHGENFPMNIGEDWPEHQKTEMILFIAKKIFVGYNSTHNMPLEASLFKMPWTPLANSSYVQL